MNKSELEAKLNGVLQEMIDNCKAPDDKAALKSAELFHGIQGLPMEVVGISVPLNAGKNRAKISFKMDHFSKTSVKVLAIEGNEDFQSAKAINQESRKN